MAIHKTVIVVCDNCEETSEPAKLAKEARLKAKQAGWRFRKGIHKCPECRTARVTTK
jgi:hypothetical protein